MKEYYCKEHDFRTTSEICRVAHIIKHHEEEITP